MSSEPRPISLGSVLVVGGCGFLGHHIVSQLLKSYSAQVSVLDLRTERNRFPSVSYYQGDVSSSATLQSVLQEVQPKVIFHTAAALMGSTDNEDFFRQVNIGGTRNLLDCAGQLGCVKAFTYTPSSSVVHDNVSDLINADERLPVLRRPVQREIYSETKAIAENLVLAANGKHGDMRTVSLRPAALFGEGDVQMLPKMLAAYDKGMWRVQLGKNDNLFDFTYVGNHAHAQILAAQALVDTQVSSVSVDRRVDGEPFVITNDHPMKFWDFVHAVWAAAGHSVDAGSVWVIPAGVAVAMAAFVEWIFW